MASNAFYSGCSPQIALSLFIDIEQQHKTHTHTHYQSLDCNQTNASYSFLLSERALTFFCCDVRSIPEENEWFLGFFL